MKWYLICILLVLPFITFAQNGNAEFEEAVTHYRNKEFLKAKAGLEQAIALGHAGAMNSMGLLYQFGEGVPQSYTEAFNWFQKAATKQDVMAIYNLSLLYRRGLGVAADLSRSFELSLQAALKGLPEAMVNTGM
eukprot:gene2499-3124_t